MWCLNSTLADVNAVLQGAAGCGHDSRSEDSGHQAAGSQDEDPKLTDGHFSVVFFKSHNSYYIFTYVSYVCTLKCYLCFDKFKFNLYLFIFHLFSLAKCTFF